MTQSFCISRLGMMVAALALLAMAASCVSSEDSRGNRATETAQDDDSIGGGSVYVDTVSPLPYEIFESVVVSQDPKKVLYRAMILREGRWEAVSRTLRLAMDSLTSADPDLAAARVTIYRIVPIDNMRGNLVAEAWAEWVPREGWDEARGGRNRMHRSYIYHQDPGWPSAEEER